MFQIGELVKCCGVFIDILCFYEKNELIVLVMCIELGY